MSISRYSGQVGVNNANAVIRTWDVLRPADFFLITKYTAMRACQFRQKNRYVIKFGFQTGTKRSKD